MEFEPLIPIGAKIKVDKSKIENLLSKEFLNNLPQRINAEIIDYKMTDGMGIGYVLKTDSNLKIWIFNSELNEETKKEYDLDNTIIASNINPKKLILGKHVFDYEINGNRNIKTIANPINLANWIIFTIKDVI